MPIRNIPFLSFVAVIAASGKPVLHLDWEDAHENFATKGSIQTVAGAEAPEYPSFAKGNQAGLFDGASRMELDDPGEGSYLDFDNGDSITIEAWVSPISDPEGSNIYIIGKGRTGNPGVIPNNQNFALRLRWQGGAGCPSFLFYSRPKEGYSGSWHRWTADDGLFAGDGWGHVAVSYTFGKPDSIRGYVNGKPSKGKWDMGGPTELPPVVDNDQVWVGSAMGGSPGCSLHGGLDNVAIHRELIPPETIAKRYERKRKERPVVKFEREDWPVGTVAFEVLEDFKPALGWPQPDVPVASAYEGDYLAMFRVPHKYSAKGIREDRPNTFLLRVLATIQLPTGDHEWILRQRWASKLWLDGKLVKSFAQTRRSGGAHGHVPVIPENWPPYLRIPSPGVGETRFTVVSTGKPVRLRLEMLVGDQSGKKRYRPDLGEALVAVSIDGAPFNVLGTNGDFPLTDHSWMSWRRGEEQRLQGIETVQRRKASLQNSREWEGKHKDAKEIALGWKVPVPPAIPSYLPANNVIDNFIGDAILRQVALGSRPKGEGEKIFHDNVFPLLKEKCFKCHNGEKAKGELRLDSLAGMLKGGESGDPALVPGNVEMSLLFTLAYSRDEGERMPPKGDPVNAGELRALRQWIENGAPWPDTPKAGLANSSGKIPTREDVRSSGLFPSSLTDDYQFLRRLSLDVCGVSPDEADIKSFVADHSADKRAKLIDRYLDSEGWAHNWVGYWQDVLAENPNILKPKLNNTGPFRDWIFESFLDNKPIDQFAYELVMMDGSRLDGGPAGFGMATQNDVPMAAKAHVLATAFLGTNLQCARCHDAPYHPFKQEDLFGMAAMLERKAISVPATSRPAIMAKGDRKPLVEVTLDPNKPVQPEWSFQEVLDPRLVDAKDSRAELATIITSGHNQRFAKVMANRVWMRYMGAGLVESADDWHNLKASNPALLDYLAKYLVDHDYDLKALARLVLNSHAYQRVCADIPEGAGKPLFAAQTRRRLRAEQIVDSLYHAAGLPMEVGELNMDRDGGLGPETFLNMGYPRKSWQYISLSNERDRPSLAFPRIQAVIDTLKQFGWRPSRQDPLTLREDAVHPLQPGILANGIMTTWLTRLSPDHGMVEVAVSSDSPETLLDTVFLRFLGRMPNLAEKDAFVPFLAAGFDTRVVPEEDRLPLPWPDKVPAVSWSNHLSPEANSIIIDLEKRARAGAHPTNALQPEWRERMEDVLWALANSPELMFVP
jgi:hypothetical protein